MRFKIVFRYFKGTPLVHAFHSRQSHLLAQVAFFNGKDLGRHESEVSVSGICVSFLFAGFEFCVGSQSSYHGHVSS